jgi:hypothetical protein
MRMGIGLLVIILIRLTWSECIIGGWDTRRIERPGGETRRWDLDGSAGMQSFAQKGPKCGERTHLSEESLARYVEVEGTMGGMRKYGTT